MANIDVALPPEIQRQLKLPVCADIRIKKPVLPKITLPTGGSIKGIADLTKGIPSDCSLNFSLAMQLAPIMASIECLVKVLALMKPLIEVVKAIPQPWKLPPLIKDFVDAAAGLKDCLLVPTPLVMIPFVRDILLLILAMLRCVIQQLRSALALLSGLELKIATARSNGNSDLLSSLECARENGKTAMSSAVMGLEPIGILLELAEPFMGIAGVDPIKLPAAGDVEDLVAVEQTLTDLQSVIETIESVVQKL